MQPQQQLLRRVRGRERLIEMQQQQLLLLRSVRVRRERLMIEMLQQRRLVR
jgi:predicted RNA-binding protein YlxR (DUF448 family)